MHTDSLFCGVLPANQYHVLFDVSTDFLCLMCFKSTDFFKKTKLYSVPCLNTTFNCLFSNGKDLETIGTVFEKLKLAVENNGLTLQKKGDTTNIQKRLPNLVNGFGCKTHRAVGITAFKTLEKSVEKKSNQQLQTDRLSTETLKRFDKILHGPHSGAFCQIMHIFVSGYGKLDIDNDVLCVRLVFEKKSFKKKFISIQKLVMLEHHMKRETFQINITHLYKFFFIKKIMSNINAK